MPASISLHNFKWTLKAVKVQSGCWVYDWVIFSTPIYFALGSRKKEKGKESSHVYFYMTSSM